MKVVAAWEAVGWEVAAETKATKWKAAGAGMVVSGVAAMVAMPRTM
jgi:hypothetical protein